MTSALVRSPRGSAVGRAYGKLILIGEHAAVYGQPAVALPFRPVDVQATIEPMAGPLALDCMFYRGPIAAAPDVVRGLVVCVREALHRLGSPLEGLLIRLVSTIPPGGGLGSSAAVAVAAVRGLYACHGQTLAQSDLMALAGIAEHYVHGTPSGIDAMAVAAERPLWFTKGHVPEPLHTGGSLELVVADTGRVGNTRSAVAAVRGYLKSQPARARGHFIRLGELAKAARIALRDGDALALGRVLDAAQAELSILGVSDAHLDRLVQAAKAAGALGAKLTGGGRGGCVLSLARDHLHADVLSAALAGAGARSTWRLTLREEG